MDANLFFTELGRLFPGIPLIGEEDAGQLRTDYEKSNASGNGSNALIESIVTALAAVSPPENGNLDCETVLQAIDRAGKDISTVTGDHPGHNTYWVCHIDKPLGIALHQLYFYSELNVCSVPHETTCMQDHLLEHPFTVLFKLSIHKTIILGSHFVVVVVERTTNGFSES